METAAPTRIEPAVVAVFEDRLKAEDAVDALEQAGFDHERIGYVIRGHDAVAGGMITDASGTKDAKGAVAGMLTGGVVGGVLAAAIAVVLPGIGPALVGGVLASFFGGAIAGTAVGGIVGALNGLGVSQDEAEFYDHQFREGKAIVAVKAGPRATVAADILRRFGGTHVHCEDHSPIETEGPFSRP